MRLPLLLASLAVAGHPLFADELNSAKQPAAADRPQNAIKSFAVAPGLQVELWAAEPHLANPVAFTFDDAGRAYVAETYRRRSSVLDIRKYDDWKVPNLSVRSVEDRIAFLKGKFPQGSGIKPTKEWPDINRDGAFDWTDLTIESEQVRVIEDSNGDGRADQARVFATGFNSLETTVGAGVVADGKGDVFYTCAPDLWRIGPDGSKTKLLSGFSAHLVFSGHEMHGARLGPDGRLYFSIADCGAKVTTKEGTVIDNPDSGAVFRCWPDGTELELFAKGLRNPQHLAFNDLGDLFTGDNNADGADKARWIHVVQGGDYGWRIGWQFMPKLGLWNSEGMWHLNAAETNPAVLPAVAHIGHGPAGIAYYPGTGLPESFRGHFFYADFPGGVRHFALKPSGATYEMADFPPDAPALQNNQPGELTAKLLWNLNPSDVQFAPGGGVMVLDWTPGWEKTGKGRIYRVFSPEADKDALTAETKRSLREGFAQREVKELVGLLGHADQRVRLGAQFELAERARALGGNPAVAALLQTAGKGPSVQVRVHALWALGMAARHNPALLTGVLAHLEDAQDEVRAQAARVIADAPKLLDPHREALAEKLEMLLTDPAPRVRFFGLQAARRAGWNADRLMSTRVVFEGDPMLRHALASAYAHHLGRGQKLPEQMASLVERGRVDATVLVDALRKAKRVEVADFLAGKTPQLALEAARAIHDEPIPAAYEAMLQRFPELLGRPPIAGNLTEKSGAGEALARRLINIAYRSGTARAAELLAQAAVNDRVSELDRVDALDALANWGTDLGRDRVLGVVVPDDGARNRADAAKSLAGVLPSLLGSGMSTALRVAATDAAGALKVATAEPKLIEAALDSAAEPKFRLAALRALGALESVKLPDAIRAALVSPDKSLAGEARKLSGKLGGAAAVEANATVLDNGSIPEQQEALANLARTADSGADRVIAEQLDRLLAGKLPPALHLDVIEAATARSAESVKARLARHEQGRNSAEPLARWQECLEGGDPKAGRVIFAEKAEAGCMRCHAVKKNGGDVGPDLGGIAARYDRAYLLRAVVEPNTEIAAGYENILVTLANGEVLAGMANKEDAETLTLKSPADGKLQAVKKADIKDRQKLPSAMPPALGDVLGKRALRDLVAYLATLK